MNNPALLFKFAVLTRRLSAVFHPNRCLDSVMCFKCRSLQQIYHVLQYRVCHCLTFCDWLRVTMQSKRMEVASVTPSGPEDKELNQRFLLLTWCQGWAPLCMKTELKATAPGNTRPLSSPVITWVLENWRSFSTVSTSYILFTTRDNLKTFEYQILIVFVEKLHFWSIQKKRRWKIKFLTLLVCSFSRKSSRLQREAKASDEKQRAGTAHNSREAPVINAELHSVFTEGL